MKHRAIVWFGPERVRAMLRLAPHHEMLTVIADPQTSEIGVIIEGHDLPPWEAGTAPMRVQPEGFYDMDLRAKLEALSVRYVGERDGIGAADVLAALDRVLAGTLDPRIELPS